MILSQNGTTSQENKDLRTRIRTTDKRIDTKTPTLQIVNFDNFLVAHPLELIPEQSNCKQRKPIGKPEQQPLHNFDCYGITFVHCSLIDLAGFDQLLSEAIYDVGKLMQVNLSNNQLSSIAGIRFAFAVEYLYLHGNKILTVGDLNELQELKQLKSVTVHGNPLVGNRQHRNYLIAKLPLVKKIDNNPITEAERRHTITLLQTPWLQLEPKVADQKK